MTHFLADVRYYPPAARPSILPAGAKVDGVRVEVWRPWPRGAR